jgi:3-aminobutyryl-CoA ammonia-lyase
MDFPPKAGIVPLEVCLVAAPSALLLSCRHEALLNVKLVFAIHSAFFILPKHQNIYFQEEIIMEPKRSMIRLRMSAKDAHYGGNLVDGAHMVHLFGDVATELLILQDGDEGLFCAYDNIEFLAPVYAGDFIEAVGEITHVGNSSRKMKFEAWKVISSRPDINDSATDVLAEPVLVCRATGTCVTPKDKQNVPRN